MAQRTSMFPFDTDQADRRALAAVQTMVDNMLATVRIARSLAQTKREIDLDGLDRDVGLLCARALDLPHPLGRQMRLQLSQLRSEIEALSVALAPAAGEPD